MDLTHICRLGRLPGPSDACFQPSIPLAAAIQPSQLPHQYSHGRIFMQTKPMMETTYNEVVTTKPER